MIKPLPPKLLAQWSAMCRGDPTFIFEGQVYDTESLVCRGNFRARKANLRPPNPVAAWTTTAVQELKRSGRRDLGDRIRPGVAGLERPGVL